jgi:simple sugar transport system permease protein
MDSASSLYPQSAPIPGSARLPAVFDGMRVHWGAIVALLAVVFYYVYLWKTKSGYELRVVGLNPNAGHYAGMNIKRSIIRSMLLAGGFAGLGGCIEIIAVQGRLMMTSFTVTYGFTGIAVALVGGNNPIGILISGVLFGGLQAGALRMQMMTDASSSVVQVIQALVILFIAGRLMFRLRTGRHLRQRTLAVPPVAMDERGEKR